MLTGISKGEKTMPNNSNDYVIIKRKKVATSANVVSNIFLLITILGCEYSVACLSKVYLSFIKVTDSTYIWGIIYLITIYFLYAYAVDNYKKNSQSIYKTSVNIILGANALVCYWGISGTIIFETIKNFFFVKNSSISFASGSMKIYCISIFISIIGSLITALIIKTGSLLKFTIEETGYTAEDIIRDQVKRELNRKEREKWEEEEWEIIQKEKAKREGRKYY